MHEKERETARLVTYAGVKGIDAEGGQLDQREFNETKDALLWLYVCQLGRHNNGGRFRKNVLDNVGSFEREGLPAEHGITMRVSKSGQSWYAWRRTITGHVFAIGSSAPDLGQWMYDGDEPPHGFPGSDRSWGVTYLHVPSNW